MGWASSISVAAIKVGALRRDDGNENLQEHCSEGIWRRRLPSLGKDWVLQPR